MLGLINKSLRTGTLTESDPFGAGASFGFPVMDFSRCTACEECVRSCPTGAIQAVQPTPERREISLSYAACIQCRACVAACPEQAISVSPDIEVCAYSREQLSRTASFDVDPATGRGTFRQAEVEAGLSLAADPYTCVRWTLAAAMAASWRSRRRPTPSTTSNGSASISSRALGTPTRCW